MAINSSFVGKVDRFDGAVVVVDRGEGWGLVVHHRLLEEGERVRALGNHTARRAQLSRSYATGAAAAAMRKELAGDELDRVLRATCMHFLRACKKMRLTMYDLA